VKAAVLIKCAVKSS